MKYRPEIDGLRAWAVVPVILFHIQPSWMPGGFTGVDIFFVISGYLITSILLDDLRSGTFSFIRFWARRVRRIMPAFLLMTLAMLVISGFMFKPDRMPLAKQAIAALLSVANLYYWQRGDDYWGPRSDEMPFLHGWSLSLEEQFYLVAPLLTWALYRRGHGWLIAGFSLMFILSLLAFVAGVVADPDAAFYLPYMRAWELLAGCLLALIDKGQDESCTRARSVKCNLLAISGLVMVGCSFFLLSKTDANVLLPVVGSVLVLTYGRAGVVSAVLSYKPLVHVGKLSYSLYLWHWPVLFWMKHFEAQFHIITTLCLLYLPAAVSFYLVEKPLRQWERSVRYILITYLMVLGAAGGLLLATPFYDTSGFKMPHWYGRFYDLKPGNEMGEEFERIIASMDAPSRVVSSNAYLQGGIITGGKTGEPPEVVVIGDSHGTMWSDAIRQVTERNDMRAAFMSMNGVPLFFNNSPDAHPPLKFLSPDEKRAYDAALAAHLKQWRPAAVVVCARWSTYVEGHLTNLFDYVSAHAGSIVLIEQPPEVAWVRNRSMLQYLCFKGIQPTGGARQYLPMDDPGRADYGRALVRHLASRYRAEVVPTFDLFAKDSRVLVLDGDEVTYVDDDHITTYGGSLAVGRIEQAILRSLNVLPCGAIQQNR